MHRDIQTSVFYLFTVSCTHTKYYVTGFLSSARDDDSISRVVCGTQGATKETNSVTKEEGKEGGWGGERYGALGRFSRGQDKKRGLH